MKTFLLLFAFLLSLTSCKKDREVSSYDGEYELSGRVLDEVSGQAIPYAVVGILETERNFSSSAKTLVSGYADSEGRFSYRFYANTEKNVYELSAGSGHYFPKSPGDGITFTKTGKKTQDIRLLPHAYLVYVIKGNKGAPYIYLRHENGGGPFRNGIDTTLTAYRLPNQSSLVGYSVYNAKNEVIFTKDENIFFKGLDTVYYLIEF